MNCKTELRLLPKLLKFCITRSLKGHILFIKCHQPLHITMGQHKWNTTLQLDGKSFRGQTDSEALSQKTVLHFSKIYGTTENSAWTHDAKMKIKLKRHVTDLHPHVQKLVVVALRQQAPGSSKNQLSTKLSSPYRVVSSQILSGWETTDLSEATSFEGEKFDR